MRIRDGRSVATASARDTPVGGTVPATLSLTLGRAGELRHVHAGRREGLPGNLVGERDLDRR